MNRFRIVALCVVLVIVGSHADVSPSKVEVTLEPGESTTVEKTVTVLPFPPLVDVVFGVDLTGSMSGEVAALKSEIEDIIDDIRAAAPDADVEFGLVTYEDYYGYFNSRPHCGYDAWYGWVGDEPYRVDAPIGSSDAAVLAAVAAMTLGNGYDGPQSYGRVFWETAQPDSGINFRDGALKLFVNFGDNVPHDCNLGEGLSIGCLPGYLLVTGIDPGRDETIGTADDIDFQDDALAAMIMANVQLIHINSGGSTIQCAWDEWSESTGGTSVLINSNGTVPGGISLSDLLLEKIEDAAVTVNVVQLVPDPDCPLDITFDPATAGPIVLDPDDGAEVVFEETIKVPDDIDPCIGEVSCEVRAYADGAEIGVQEIIVTVPDTTPPTLDLTTSADTLWPPNHKMVEVVVCATAEDDCCDEVTLGVKVASNEPVDGTGDGDTAPDWEVVSIDQDTGKITLNLRAERKGDGSGRVYTIKVTATDCAGNETVEKVEVTVPHDQSKK